MDLEPSSKHQSYTNNSMNTGLCWVGGKGQKAPARRYEEEEEEEWDDSQRYKDNFTKLQQSQFCLYHVNGAKDQQIVHYESSPKLISDPIYYEVEHKRRQVWNVRDIENFLQSILENPKNFWMVGKSMPHKTSKDLVCFYQTFKKLFNLKKHFKTCFVLMSLPSQAVKNQAI